jgi:hypothetical protein
VITYELLQPDGVLIIRPAAPLETADFQRLAQEIDPYIEVHGKLHGVMLDAESFPGWKDFAALVAHLRFVRDHHRNVQKVAAVTDSTFLSVVPTIAGHFVRAEVRHFPHAQRDEALAWLRGEGH